MPVIRYVPQDPTDLMILGEQMRSAAFGSSIGLDSSPWSPLLVPSRPYALLETSIWSPLISLGYIPMQPALAGRGEGVLCDPFQGTMVAVNAGIATPCGAFIPHTIGAHLMDAVFVESTSRWLITGETQDCDTGVAEGGYTVIVFDVGRLTLPASPAVPQEAAGLGLTSAGVFYVIPVVTVDNVNPVVAMTVSDAGTGAYSVEVPGFRAYQVMIYKTGVPDKGGVSVNTLTPNIQL